MTPLLIALIAVLPVAAAGIALLFISGAPAPKGARRSPIDLLHVK
jgi:hypothetical protein